nr:hypothetical protein Iba_chr02eCG2310 [Ipomoea batatas]
MEIVEKRHQTSPLVDDGGETAYMIEHVRVKLNPPNRTEAEDLDKRFGPSNAVSSGVPVNFTPTLSLGGVWVP